MLKLQLCGGVTVEVDGRPLPDTLLAGRQGRLVLAYLVCERRRSVPREELAELLWPERLPSSWTSSLSVVVSKLRRLLGEAGLDGPAALASAFGSYRLLLPDDVWIDWEVAFSAVARGEQALTDGLAEVATTAAREAARIAEQGFLTDDSPWVDVERERLRDLHVRALLLRVQGCLLGGQHGHAVIAAREALALDEMREIGYRLLMQALAAVGERAEALRVWERCRVTLADELGADPSPETEAVYLSILGEAPMPPAGPAAATEPLPSGVVTFLLTDIVDSSTLWDQNPAAMAIALERHDRLVAETVRSHDGALLKAKLEGDATVSVFRRASDAARAALALRDALAVEGWPEGAVIELRMALHTGEALERDGDYFGPALNRAARLRGLARAGQILISQVVAGLVRDQLPDTASLASLGEHQLRGLAQGEHVFELGPAGVFGDDEAESGPLQRPPLPAVLAAGERFVGREAELERLGVEWATVTSGTTRAVLIAGEPGVGKSRLAAEWARRAFEQGALVLYGRCDEELGASYQPFAEALRALLPSVGSARLRSIRGVGELGRLVPELTDLLPGGATPGQADPDTERALLFDGLARLFAAVSSEVPVVIVIDDLHWAQKPTLLLLRHLLRAGDEARVLIVATYRSTDLSRAHPLAAVLADLHRDGTADRLALAGLAPTEVSAFLRAGGLHDDGRLGEALSTVTSGNPFFLIEVLRHLKETGDAWDPTTLPQGVREAVDRRLSRLSASANDALLAGAVAGSRFSLDLIEQVLDRDLVEPIEEASRAGLLVEEPGNQFRFYHALVRQSLLAECVSVKRVRLHQRIAAALEADPAAVDDARVADLARHYFECAFAGGAAKAVGYSRQAGEQAMARLAYEEAADLYAQALEAAGIEGSGCDDDDRAELLVARCEALLAAGDPNAAVSIVEQLTHAARRSPRLSAWATCFTGQLAVLIHPERLEATVAEVMAAAEAFARLGDTEGEAKAHTVAASCLARLGRIADCEAALDRALVAARLAGNPRRVNAVLGFAPQASLWGPSPVPEASGRCLDVVRVLRITTGSAAVEAAALRCQAVLEAVRGRIDAARRMLGSARGSLEALGHTHGLLETDLFSGLVELIGGHATEAEELLRRAYEGYTTRGVGTDTAQAAAWLARAVLAQGRVDEALELSAESEGRAGVDLKASMAWRAVRAEGLAQQGQTAKALELAQSALALVEPTDALLDQAEAHLTLAVVLRAAGDASGAEREADRAVEAYEMKGATALAAAVRPIARAPRTASMGPTASSVAFRRVRPNPAYGCAGRSARLFEQGDIDGWAASFADEFVYVDHISHVTSDRATFLKAARTSGADQVATDRELLATLGERHALTRCTYRYEGAPIGDRSNRTGPAEFNQLLVEVIDVLGRECRLERFKPDDLLVALARLIELHADDELPVGRRQERQTIAAQFRNAVQSRGEAQWHDDALMVDHRPARLGTLHGPNAIRSAAASADILSPDEHLRVADVLGFTERVILVEAFQEGHDDEGGYLRVPFLAVTQYGDDGLVRRLDVYLHEQLDDALSLFDQLVKPAGDGHLDNEATRWLTHLWDLEFAADWDSVARLIDETAVLDDRRSIVGLRVEGREAFLAYVRSAFESGLTHGSSVAIATRGRRLALMRNTTGGPLTEVQSLGVSELSETGCLQHSVAFDLDDEGAAFDELDARYLAGEGVAFADAVQVSLGFVAAYDREDLSRCGALLSPGLIVVDHRSGQERQGHEAHELLANLRTSFERLRVISIDAIEHEGVVFLCRADREPGFHLVCVTHQGLIARLDIFQPEECEPALARLRDAPSSVRLITRRRVRPNTATEQHTKGLLASGDVNALAAEVSDDFVDVDHVSKAMTGRAELLRMFRIYAETERRETEVELLASLGERHALHRTTTRTEGAAIGERQNSMGIVEHALAIVSRTDADGRLARLERFRSGDLDLALARLIELHADDELPLERRPGRYIVASHFRDAMGAFNDDTVLIDHRPAGLWSLHGGAATRDAEAGLENLITDWQWRTTDVLALTDHLCLNEVVGDGHNDEGGPVQFRMIALSEYGDDGHLHRAELYGPDQIDEAFGRLDELQAGVEDIVLSNEATQMVALSREAIRHGDIDAVAALTAADAVLDDRRTLYRYRLDGREAHVNNALSVIEIGAHDISSVPVALRGTRLALNRMHAGGLLSALEALVLSETSGGYLWQTVLFDADQLDDAFDELDRRYLAGEGAPHADTLRPWFELTAACGVRDLARCRELFSDSLEVVDHRSAPVSRVQTQGRDQFLAAMSRGRVLRVESVEHDRALLLWQDADTELRSYLLTITNQAEITQLEFFGLDQGESAAVRLHATSTVLARAGRRRALHRD